MKKLKLPVCFMMLCGLFFLSFWGCAGQPEKRAHVRDGREYGKVQGTFRHRWWNHYERAVSFEEGQFYSEAAADLKEAIHGREKDQRMARTYGMHFVDYFPHRELGIVRYRMGDLDAAMEELELSGSQYPSAKARYYLDRVRKALIERRGRKGRPPLLTLLFEGDEVWTRDDPVMVSGVARDEQYVSEVVVGGRPLFLEGSEKRIPFKEPMKLTQGPHAIEIEARDLAGLSTKKTLLIHVDREGPTITVDTLRFEEGGSGKTLRVEGSVYDEAGVYGLRLNDRAISVRKKTEVFFSERIPGDRETLEVTARDRLGNETRAGIPLPSRRSAQRPVLLACAGSEAGALVFAGLFGSKDIRPPVVKLRGWTDEQTVYLAKVYIEGQVNDENTVESLTINGTSLLRRKGKYIFFNHLEELKEGKNTIAIAASDEAGNTATRDRHRKAHSQGAPARSENAGERFVL